MHINSLRNQAVVSAHHYYLTLNQPHISDTRLYSALAVALTADGPPDISCKCFTSQVSVAQMSATDLLSVMTKLSKTMSSDIDHSSKPTAP